MRINTLIFCFLITPFACKAQNTTVGIYESEDYGNYGVYYKDLNNDFNLFIGSWKYENGNTSLIINFQKKILRHIQDDFSNYYLDALVGEYQYIENGVEKLNTLDNLSQDYQDPFYYNITGDSISKYGDNLCINCEPGNVKVYSLYSEPNCDIPGITPEMVFRYYAVNGVEKLECKFYPTGMALNSGDNPCLGNKLPYGRYTLVKQ